MTDDHIPTQHIIDFYDHLQRVLDAVKTHQAESAQAAVNNPDERFAEARYVYLLGLSRTFLRHALHALEPLRFGPTPERLTAAEEALEELDGWSETMANVIRNAKQANSNAFLFAIGDAINVPFRENFQKGISTDE